ncbi:uncharacterized protein [Spinacia oleracea]|uniref:Uncharacterized protein n=1 Tax=Spinacia oleracea TaxID=3562 RepID=A0ABM3QZU3_SPIOL|nr:uncharacterized protein LOC110803427 [Spinacia oleracea]
MDDIDLHLTFLDYAFHLAISSGIHFLRLSEISNKFLLKSPPWSSGKTSEGTVQPKTDWTDWSYVRNEEIPVSKILSCGYLYLRQPLGPWIETNSPSQRKLVRKLELYLRHSSIERIENSIWKLVELTHLYIYYGDDLKCLPRSLTRLHKLEFLEIDSCISLNELPPNLGELKSLKHLSLARCSAIEYLPSSITELPKLMVLNLEDCRSLLELPENLGDLVQLLHLHISNCCEIKSLPCSTTKLCNLETLVLPSGFGVETLYPFKMNKCVIITVEGSSISYRIWDELRKEIAPKMINGTLDLPYHQVKVDKTSELRKELERKVVGEAASIEEPRRGIVNQQTSPLNLPDTGGSFGYTGIGKCLLNCSSFLQTDSHDNDNSENQHTSGYEPVLPSSAGGITTKLDCFIRETEIVDENTQHPTQNGHIENEQNQKTPHSDDEKNSRQTEEIAPEAIQSLMKLVDTATELAATRTSNETQIGRVWNEMAIEQQGWKVA